MPSYARPKFSQSKGRFFFFFFFLCLHMALRCCLAFGRPDALVAKVGEVCDRAIKCESAQRLAFTAAIKFAHRLVIDEDGASYEAHRMEGKTAESGGKIVEQGGGIDLATARKMCRRVFEECIDHHKHQAYPRVRFSSPRRLTTVLDAT
mmetsp:Transcript_29396/g.55027  ORF Transcript_29396/g.55027 Transcript_29396/m.55027 type:complete len:149 (-) Transcript_29396:17-463(-)